LRRHRRAELDGRPMLGPMRGDTRFRRWGHWGLLGSRAHPARRCGEAGKTGSVECIRLSKNTSATGRADGGSGNVCLLDAGSHAAKF
jgi:hypothetical protein